jgi:hypothetical protein
VSFSETEAAEDIARELQRRVAALADQNSKGED